MNPTTPPFDSEWLNHRHAGRHGHALKKMRCRRDSRQEEGHVEGKREKAAGGEVMSGGGAKLAGGKRCSKVCKEGQ